MRFGAVVEQVGLALAYYVGLIAIIRSAGKRLAGQTATADLVVLIALGVVLQGVTLRPGPWNALVFIATAFAAHRLVSFLTARFRAIRKIVRGAPRPLVQNGVVSMRALAEEGLDYDDLMAGLRKCGHTDPKRVKLAVLEETGEITAIGE